MRTLIVLLISVLFFSCKPKEIKKPDPITFAESKQQFNLVESVKHYFSDPKAKDSFVIRLKGHSILNSKIAFEIFNPKGERIFREDFPARFFLNYDLNEPSTDQEKEDFIVKRMKEFFKEDNFNQPAVKKSDILDTEYSDKKVWEEIQSDPTAVGFYYELGQEDGRSIAYVKKENKVVTFFNCC
jgi:hypothetical protein